MEEEVITPPKGGGGRPAPEPQGSPRGVRAVPNLFPRRWSGSSERYWIAGRYVSGHGGTNAEGHSDTP